MKTAKDYRVTFPYGATRPPYSPSHPHKGNDRAMPTGVPIVIGDTTIGLSGASGKVTGPHLHTQAGKDFHTQRTVKPDRLEFKPGVVANRRTDNEGEWGRFVTIQVGKEYITYAHLDKVNVKVGDRIKEDMYKGESAKTWYTLAKKRGDYLRQSIKMFKEVSKRKFKGADDWKNIRGTLRSLINWYKKKK